MLAQPGALLALAVALLCGVPLVLADSGRVVTHDRGAVRDCLLAADPLAGLVLAQRFPAGEGEAHRRTNPVARRPPRRNLLGGQMLDDGRIAEALSGEPEHQPHRLGVPLDEAKLAALEFDP